jgi:pyruvate dehydrogenase E2 component (dihydrolipoamide acetyltransferase)
MAEAIRMPKMSDTMTEGVIAAWHKKVGDIVKSGDIIAEVETDKATMDLESYQEGTLLYIGAAPGQAVAIDGVMAIVGNAGEDFQALLGGATTSPQPVAAPAPVVQEAVVVTNAAPAEAINATVIRMPKMSDTMTEGVLVAWLKKVGDVVKSGDMIAEVETDKATMELESYEDGTILYLGVQAGEAVPIDGIIAIIGEAGAHYQALLSNSPQAVVVDTPQPSSSNIPSAPNTQPLAAAIPTTHDERVKASPLAKALAKDKGLDLAKITGSGEGGRIVKRDIDSSISIQSPVNQVSTQTPATQPAVVATASPAGGYEDFPVSQMRKTIARRLSESMFTAPHFYLTMEITMDKAMVLRGQMNEVSPTKISFNDMVIKAAALALKQHPNVNSAWLGDKIRRYDYVNIGVAVAVDEGLLVPVVRDADKKSLSTIGSEVKDFAGRAKDKKLQPKDWEGNTFSISNLGMFGIDEFTAIINPPDACILAVGGIKQTAAFKEDGTPYPTNVMKVTLSCDHRVVDGATGASFLQTFKKLLENPLGMLV